MMARRDGVDLGKISEIISPESLEYAALKQEQQTRLILRDTALYVTVGGILTSASILSATTPAAALRLSEFLSYAAPAFSLAMFLIYFRSDFYLSTARRYIVRDLGPRIVDHFALAAGAALKDDRLEHNFGWETYHQRPRALWLAMRLTATLVTLGVFLAPIAISYLFSESVSGEALASYPTLLAGAVCILIVTGVARLTLFD
jgi:hypothetical protein